MYVLNDTSMSSLYFIQSEINFDAMFIKTLNVLVCSLSLVGCKIVILYNAVV